MISRHLRKLFSTVPSLKGFQDIKNHKPASLTRAQVEEQLKVYGIKNWSFVPNFNEDKKIEFIIRTNRDQYRWGCQAGGMIVALCKTLVQV
jgi:hypothetical protein